MSDITQTAKEKIIVINTDEGKYECEIRNIPLSDLKLDPTNPRLIEVGITPENITSYDQAFVAKAIKEIADWKDLKESVKATGGLQDPPFIKKDSDGKYSVREGSRRTLTLRDIEASIQNQEKGYEKFVLEDFTMPECIIYPTAMTERAIALHLGQIHVVGKAPWGPFQKAGHCKRLVSLGVDQDTIVKVIRLSKSCIKEYLWARERLLEYKKAYPKDQNWTTKFSHFQKIHSKSWLLDTWWKNPKNQGSFMAWVNKGKIPEAFRIAGKIGLREVIADPVAYDFFEKDGNDLNEAVDLIKRKKKRGDTLDEMQDEIFESIRFLHENLGRLTQSKMEEIVGDKEQLAIVKELSNRFAEINKKLSKG